MQVGLIALYGDCMITDSAPANNRGALVGTATFASRKSERRTTLRICFGCLFVSRVALDDIIGDVFARSEYEVFDEVRVGVWGCGGD